ncbi:MAG: MFS transporter, partial [Planctomycetaceae bacterium]
KIAPTSLSDRDMSASGLTVLPVDEDQSLYNRTFWLAYAANLMLVAANAITFRFAEFVNFLGGAESDTGSIVRAGVVGSLFIRLTLARDLDRLGVRRMWLGSSILFILGCGLLLTADSIGWQVYLARAAFMSGLASMFTCSNVHIQNQAPIHRRTELIGSLGSSGFVGMMLGAQLGDLIFASVPRGEFLFQLLFGLAGLLALGYLLIVSVITRKDVHIHQPDTPPPWSLLRKYWPGPVVIVAFVMGLSFVVTTVFLTRHATSLGLVGVRTYFSGYSLAAFVFRIATRTWSRTLGRHRMILLGLLGHTIGFLLLWRVHVEWDYVLPSLCGGFAHALLFPCVVSLGAERYPERYRGSGTTLILGFIDVGGALGAQPLGWVIDHYGFGPMYLGAASVCFSALLVYGLLMFHAPDADQEHARREFGHTKVLRDSDEPTIAPRENSDEVATAAGALQR